MEAPRPAGCDSLAGRSGEKGAGSGTVKNWRKTRPAPPPLPARPLQMVGQGGAVEGRARELLPTSNQQPREQELAVTSSGQRVTGQDEEREAKYKGSSSQTKECGVESKDEKEESVSVYGSAMAGAAMTSIASTEAGASFEAVTTLENVVEQKPNASCQASIPPSCNFAEETSVSVDVTVSAASECQRGAEPEVLSHDGAQMADAGVMEINSQVSRLFEPHSQPRAWENIFDTVTSLEKPLSNPSSNIESQSQSQSGTQAQGDGEQGMSPRELQAALGWAFESACQAVETQLEERMQAQHLTTDSNQNQIGGENENENENENEIQVQNQDHNEEEHKQEYEREEQHDLDHFPDANRSINVAREQNDTVLEGIKGLLLEESVVSENAANARLLVSEDFDGGVLQSLGLSSNMDDVTCPICFEVFCSAYPRIVMQCKDCSSSFCGPCLDASLKRTENTCPMCRHSLDAPTRNYDIENALGKLPGTCEFCNVSVLTSELNEHELKCSQRPKGDAKGQLGKRVPGTGLTTEILGVSNSDTLSGEFWSCSVCTYFNEPSRRKCEMCSLPNPERFRANRIGSLRRTESDNNSDDSDAGPRRESTGRMSLSLLRRRNDPHNRRRSDQAGSGSRESRLQSNERLAPGFYSLLNPTTNNQGFTQITLLWRTRTKILFQKWKPALFTLSRNHIFIHDPQLANQTSLTDRNALKVVPLVPGSCVTPVHTTQGSVVTKSKVQGGAIVRTVSPSATMYRVRVYKVANSSGGKRKKILLAEIGSCSRAGLEFFVGFLRQGSTFVRG